ncbi:hypothetical protein [Bdellovibrio sp. GT3]|uniref:hypothetical protein n=1 Tax=Bdellovibrio sp. GT3 TaxID=3136282 RepID=UPI0030F23CBD
MKDQTFILDVNALLKFPQVLATSSLHQKIIILPGVRKELEEYIQLNKPSFGKTLISMIENKVVGTSIRILESLDPLLLNTPSDIPTGKEALDRQLILYTDALQKANPDSEVYLVTDDARISTAFRLAGREKLTLPVREFQEKIDSIHQDSGVKGDIENAKKESSKRLAFDVINALLAVFAAIVSVTGWDKIQTFLTSIPIDGLIYSGILTLPFILYFCRFKWRWKYGLAELVFGLLLTGTSIHIATLDKFETIAKIASGLFLCVRGLDSFHVGISDSEWAVRFPILKIKK